MHSSAAPRKPLVHSGCLWCSKAIRSQLALAWRKGWQSCTAPIDSGLCQPCRPLCSCQGLLCCRALQSMHRMMTRRSTERATMGALALPNVSLPDAPGARRMCPTLELAEATVRRSYPCQSSQHAQALPALRLLADTGLCMSLDPSSLHTCWGLSVRERTSSAVQRLQIVRASTAVVKICFMRTGISPIERPISRAT